MNNQFRILKIIEKSHKGMTARNIQKQMLAGEISVLHITISQMVKRDFLKVDGKIPCSECGHAVNYYRISQKGREYLAEKACA